MHFLFSYGFKYSNSNLASTFFFRIQNRLKFIVKTSPTFGVEAKPEGGQVVVQSFKNKV